jgi:hypothetical protein
VLPYEEIVILALPAVLPGTKTNAAKALAVKLPEKNVMCYICKKPRLKRDGVFLQLFTAWFLAQDQKGKVP